MSRQRFIYPKIWRSPDFNRLTPDEQLMFIGCFSTADDHGRRRAEPELLKADIFPLREDMTIAKIEYTFDGLVNAKMVRPYIDSNGRYLDLPSWKKYQHPKYVRESELPAFRAELSRVPAGSRAMGSGCGCNSGLGTSNNYGNEKRHGVVALHPAKGGTNNNSPVNPMDVVRRDLPRCFIQAARDANVGLYVALKVAQETGCHDLARLLAWLRMTAADGRVPGKIKTTPDAYWTALAKGGKSPPQDFYDDAKRDLLLESDSTELTDAAMRHFADCLPKAGGDGR